jgi:beta-barrel assembly-enhancing protease
MRSQIGWLALLVAALFLVQGCAAAAVALPAAAIAAKGATKASEASRPINDSEEYYVGRAVAARILGKYPLDQNVKLTNYVNEVGETVARKSSRPRTFRGYHFAVLDTQEINAFACPGGTIFITRGLVQTCATEDQLAAVLAHEVAHVAHKDGVNSISKARWSQVFTAMGTEAAKQYGGVGGSLVTLFEGSIDDVFKTIVVNGYSRSAEEAADKDAITTLTRAGYDPRALVQVLDKMVAKEKGTSGGIFKTHPPTGDRLAKVKAEAGEGSAPKDEAVRTKRFKGIVG